MRTSGTTTRTGMYLNLGDAGTGMEVEDADDRKGGGEEDEEEGREPVIELAVEVAKVGISLDADVVRCGLADKLLVECRVLEVWEDFTVTLDLDDVEGAMLEVDGTVVVLDDACGVFEVTGRSEVDVGLSVGRGWPIIIVVTNTVDSIPWPGRRSKS